MITFFNLCLYVVLLPLLTAWLLTQHVNKEKKIFRVPAPFCLYNTIPVFSVEHNFFLLILLSYSYNNDIKRKKLRSTEKKLE
jgi:hypothetical protein